MFKHRRSLGLAGALVAGAVCLAAGAAAGGVYDGWARSLDLSINTAGKVGTNLTDYPVLVVLSPERTNNYAGFAPGGADLRFSDATGHTALSYEIERFDPNGNSYIWVKVPTVAGSTTTNIQAHWGRPAAASESNGQAVFSNGFAGVWHLSETGGVHNDSAGLVNNTGTPAGTVVQGGPGLIDGANTFATSSDYVAIGSSSELAMSTAGTIQAWARMDNWATPSPSKDIINNNIPYVSSGVSDTAYLSQHNTVGLHFRYGQSGGGWVSWSGSKSWDANSWHLVGTSWERVGSSTAVKLFADDQQAASNTFSHFINQPETAWNIARDLDGAESAHGPFPGSIDEVRISNVARPLDWIKADYYGGSDNLIAYGASPNFYSPGVAAAARGYWKLNDPNTSSTALNSGQAGSSLDAGFLVNRASPTSTNKVHAEGLVLGSTGPNDAAYFNGTASEAAIHWAQGSGINTASSTGGNVFASDWTIETWFERDAITSGAGIFSQNKASAPIFTFRLTSSEPNKLGIMNSHASWNGLFLDLGEEHLDKRIYAVMTKTGSNQWDHATDPTQINIYAKIEGEDFWRTVSGNPGFTLSPGDDFLIGRHALHVDGHAFSGTIDDLAIYDFAIDFATIQRNYVMGTVPEPSALLLLAMALAGLLGVRRGRRVAD